MAPQKNLTITIVSKGRPASLERCVRSVDVDCPIIICAHDAPDVSLVTAKDDRVRVCFNQTDSIVKCQNYLASISHGAILPTSDDVEYGYRSISKAYKKLMTTFDGLGVVGFNQKNLPGSSHFAFMLIGRRYYEKFGLFYPDYMHFFADTEFGELAVKRNLFFWDETATLTHHHPSVTGQYDETHKHRRNEKLSHDTDLYTRRKEHMADCRVFH